MARQEGRIHSQISKDMKRSIDPTIANKEKKFILRRIERIRYKRLGRLRAKRRHLIRELHYKTILVCKINNECFEC